MAGEVDRAGTIFALLKLSHREMKGATGSICCLGTGLSKSPDLGSPARAVPFLQEEGGLGSTHAPLLSRGF